MLSYIRFTSIKRSISITVPSDGTNYKVKGGEWKDDLTPLAFGEVRPQVAIFKLDDLRYEYKVDKKLVYDYTDFVSLADWANKEKVALSFGVICNTLEDEEGIDKSGYYKAIADMDASEYIEICSAASFITWFADALKLSRVCDGIPSIRSTLIFSKPAPRAAKKVALASSKLCRLPISLSSTSLAL